MTWIFRRHQLAKYIGGAKPGVSPTWLTPPSISNAPPVPGNVVTYNHGSVGAYPYAAPTFEVLLDDVPVSGQPYVIVLGDVGKTLKVRGTVTNDLGTAVSTSAGVTIEAGVQTRITLSGQNILDENGDIFVPRGFAFGHGELVQPGQITAAAAMGANTARFNVRLWGDWGQGFRADGQDVPSPGHIDPAYLAMIDWQIDEARACGMKVLLAPDSDCGQGSGGAACTINGNPDQDFWTADGQQQRQWWIETAQFLAARYIGKVDLWEPIVEPHSPNANQTKTWTLQEEIMTAVLAVDPAMVFVIGPYPGYGPNYIGNCYKAAWADTGSPFHNKIVLTANLLDFVVTDTYNRIDRINKVNAAKTTNNVPAMVQQVGSTTTADLNSLYLKDTLLRMNALGIGYTVWEHTSLYEGGYGDYWLTDPNDQFSARALKPTRHSVLQACFTGIPETSLLASKRVGGQIASPMDYIGDAIWQDLMRYARNFAMPIGSPYQYQEPDTLLRVASLTRDAAGVVSVVLSEAPGNAQDLATGMRLVLTCPSAPTFDADHALITVTNSTHFTYQSTAGVASYTAVNIYDIPAAVINSVQVGSNGQPIADFYSIISTVSGTATSKPDLNGVYNGVFPGTPPANISVAGAALSNYTAGGSTFTLTIDSLDTQFIAINFTGVPTNGTFVKPRIIRTDHDQSGATLLRPDYAQYASRFGLMRFMDAGKLNNNAFIKSWANRPKVSQGLGMPLEDMVAMCNELLCDMWYCVPQWASADYVTQAMTYIRDNLYPYLNVYVERVNETWNEQTFFHPMWYLTDARALLKAHFHGFYGENVITSVSRSGGVVTVNMNRVPPFANGATAVFKITNGSTGYDTPDAGAVMTVSGNSFSFTGGTASGAASVTEALIVGDPTNPIYSYDYLTYFRLIWTRMHAKRTYDMAQLVSTVFGGLNGRARVLLMGWNTNFVEFGNLEDYGIKWLEAQYGPTKNWLWGIGGAPYALASAGDTTAAAVLASVESQLDSFEAYFHRASYLAHRYAHEHIQYEGGPDLTALGNNHTLIDSLYSAPEYRTAQKDIIDRAIGFGVDRHCVYNTSVATPGGPGSQTWGLWLSLTADGGAIGAATSTRLKGLDDALMVAPTAYLDPNQLPGTLYFQGGTGFKDDATSTFATNGMRALYSANSQVENLFYVQPADGGQDRPITIWGGCVPGSGTNGVRVYLDDVLVGTLDLPTAASLASMPSGGSASATTITLPAVSAGKHRLKIKAPASQPDEVGVSKVVGI